MEFARARLAIALAARDLGITEEEMVRQIDAAIEEAMNSKDPLVQARFMFIPREGERPTALEFIEFAGNLLHAMHTDEPE